jgi:hypothetical protein
LAQRPPAERFAVQRRAEQPRVARVLGSSDATAGSAASPDRSLAWWAETWHQDCAQPAWRAVRKAPTMRHLTATAALVSCTILVASCLQGSETVRDEVQRSDGPEPTGEAQQAADGVPYTSKEFQFTVQVKDDGEGKGGGWQVDHPTLGFATSVNHNIIYSWNCRFEIGMPLRTEKEGRISSFLAALYTAEVANDVVFPLMGSRNWTGQGTAFCEALKEGMNTMFEKLHPKLGARVKRDP